MYVRHSVHIEQPCERCIDALRRDRREWFPRLSDGISAVGPRTAGVPIRKRVRIELGEPVEEGSWLVVPIAWRASSFAQLFPEMSGRIELAPVDADRTRLTIRGHYEPPLGGVGAALDPVMMHRVAEATVRELAESIATRLKRNLRKAQREGP